MKSLLKILFSIPVILVIIYFMPFIGVFMLIARKFIVGSGKYNIGIIFLIITGIIVLPKVILFITDLFKMDNISMIDDIINSDIYKTLFERSKLLFILGILALILNIIMNRVKQSALNGLMSYINGMEMQDKEIALENDLKMREKQDRAKNIHFVHCPHCGADNHFSGSTGKCRYCKRTLEYKE